jgi:hypothetical protein
MKFLYAHIQRKNFGRFVRLGYLIRGILYVSVGIIALEFVSGLRNTILSTSGVISIMYESFAGNYLIFIIIAGLGGYALWGLLRAFADYIVPYSEHINILNRIGYLLSAGSYIALTVATIKLSLHIQNQVSPTEANQFIVMLVSYPYGNILLLGFGILIMLGGIIQIVKSIRADDPGDFLSEDLHRLYSTPFMIFAKIGTFVRGCMFVLIGYFVTLAGIHTDPTQIKGVADIMRSLSAIHGGVFWVSAIGIGFIFFGIYSALLSIWVDLP